jgi:NADH dehydrogenase FAD-containing subunit
MVPGWLSGAYRFDEIVIDFQKLCHAAGARWLEGELEGLNARRRVLRLRSGEELRYDLLSLNVGATLSPPVSLSTTMMAMRPLSQLRPAFEALLTQWTASSADSPFTVTAVGGGAAGFESLLAVLARLRLLRPDRIVRGALISRGETLLPGMSRAARRAGHRALSRAGATLHLDTSWSAAFHSDLVLWATGAEAQAWQRDPLRNGSLAVSEQGFIRVDRRLRSLSHPQVFAVGDCADWSPPLPKAGVYAVRMGVVLSHNLRASLSQGHLRRYEPQQRFLALLSTGDGRAIASRGPFGTEGRWAWHWKNLIDRRFVGRFANPVEVRGAARIHSPQPHAGDSS